MTDKYTLDSEGNAVPEPDLITWAKWFETSNRRVRLTHVDDGRTPIDISTVFLGLDHNFGFSELRPPILWETLIRGGPHDGEQWRYSSKEEAAQGHEEALRVVLKDLPGAKVTEAAGM